MYLHWRVAQRRASSLIDLPLTRKSAAPVIDREAPGHYRVVDRKARRSLLMSSPKATETAPVGGLREQRAAKDRLRQLVESHFDFVWRSVRRLGVREADSDDAVQRVFLIVSEKLDVIEPAAERSFLFQTALRVASHARRKYRNEREVPDDNVELSLGSYPSPEDLSDQKRMRQLADQVLHDMPLELRAVLIMFEVQEMTTPEIAEILGIPLGTAASRLRRAREDFKKRVESFQQRQVEDD